MNNYMPGFFYDLSFFEQLGDLITNAYLDEGTLIVLPRASCPYVNGSVFRYTYARAKKEVSLVLSRRQHRSHLYVMEGVNARRGIAR